MYVLSELIYDQIFSVIYNMNIYSRYMAYSLKLSHRESWLHAAIHDTQSVTKNVLNISVTLYVSMRYVMLTYMVYMLTKYISKDDSAKLKDAKSWWKNTHTHTLNRLFQELSPSL